MDAGNCWSSDRGRKSAAFGTESGAVLFIAASAVSGMEEAGDAGSGAAHCSIEGTATGFSNSAASSVENGKEKRFAAWAVGVAPMGEEGKQTAGALPGF
jgi:hypothetical protein